MIGQGSPNRAIAHLDRRAASARGRLIRALGARISKASRAKAATLAAIVLLLTSTIAFADPTMQLRVIWNCGDRSRQLQGTVSIDRGKLDFVRAIGSQPDEPGSMWLDDNRIEVRERARAVKTVSRFKPPHRWMRRSKSSFTTSPTPRRRR